MSGRTKCNETVCNGNYRLRLAWNHPYQKSCYPSPEQVFLSALSSSSAVLLQVRDGGSYAWVSRQMMCRNAFYKKQSLSARGALYSVYRGTLLLLALLPNRQADIIRFRSTEAPGLLSQGVIGTSLAPRFSCQVLEPAWSQRFQRPRLITTPRTPIQYEDGIQTALASLSARPSYACLNLAWPVAPPARAVRLTSRVSFSSWLCSLALSHPHSLACQGLSGTSKIMRAHAAPPKVCLIIILVPAVQVGTMIPGVPRACHQVHVNSRNLR